MSDLDVIKEIEKIIGEELKPCPSNMDIMDKNARCKLASTRHGLCRCLTFSQ
jgi:hypothetical protein